MSPTGSRRARTANAIRFTRRRGPRAAPPPSA
jgi:hypothetical protein